MSNTSPPSTADAAGTDAFADADSAEAATIDDNDNDASAAASSDIDAADNDTFDNANAGVFKDKATVNIADNNAAGNDADSNAAVDGADNDANSDAAVDDADKDAAMTLLPMSLLPTPPMSPPTVVTVSKKLLTVPSCLVLRLILISLSHHTIRLMQGHNAMLS